MSQEAGVRSGCRPRVHSKWDLSCSLVHSTLRSPQMIFCRSSLVKDRSESTGKTSSIPLRSAWTCAEIPSSSQKASARSKYSARFELHTRVALAEKAEAAGRDGLVEGHLVRRLQ